MNMKQIVAILAILTMVAICVQPVAAATEDEATNYYNIAERFVSEGNYKQALIYFDRVLTSNTTLLGMGDGLMYTYKDRAAVLTDLGLYNDAIKASDLGISHYPNNSGLWNNKGYAYFKMGKYNEAVDAYNRAVTIDPTYLKGWINKGNALIKAGRAGEAVDAYKQALALDPGNSDAAAGLAEAEKAAGPSLQVIGIIVLILAGIGVLVWYLKFRKPADAKTPGKGKEKK
jgi:tetratricopeptide (TPR) repeat protein